ncbi:MAG: hypothetical protein ACLFWB_08405 [Armatimonadota bacterium]
MKIVGENWRLIAMITVVLWIVAVVAILLAATVIAAVVLTGQISRELRTRTMPGGRTDPAPRRSEHE